MPVSGGCGEGVGRDVGGGVNSSCDVGDVQLLLKTEVGKLVVSLNSCSCMVTKMRKRN